MAIVNSYKKAALEGGINLATDTVKVMLLTSTHVTDIDLDVFIDDVSANEVSGTGYTAGGQALTTKAVTQDNTNDLGKFDADDVTWATATITARFAVIYKDTGTASTSPIVNIVDFGADRTSTGVDFVINWNANGILTLS